MFDAGKVQCLRSHERNWISPCRTVFLKIKFSSMPESTTAAPLVLHPMAKFQRQVRSLVESNVIKPSDKLWKIAFLFKDNWEHWKQELEDFEFSMQDPISDLLAVESWEEEV